MSVARFVKPDVPWLHELEPGLLWNVAPWSPATVRSVDGRWEAYIIDEPRDDGCPARTTSRPRNTDDLMPDGGFFCSLPYAHESPHIASRGRYTVVWLRRVARPGEVAS